MAEVITCRATDGTELQFVNQIVASGGMKDVYFSPDHSYVVAFFREQTDLNTTERLESIVGKYREGIFQQIGGEYWKNLFCWPNKIVFYNGMLGVVSPVYQDDFFFSVGSKNNDFLSIKGKEKNGRWFASAQNQNTVLAAEERGHWFNYFQVCLSISRAMRRMHAAGLAHSDLSFNNVLVAPTKGRACIIDIDGLVVPDKFPPEVLGTRGFIAPEVYETKHLALSDPLRILPSIKTDRHALAVLIYFYLLYRDPLEGCKVWDINDADRDEILGRGKCALFIENPHDTSNHVRKSDLKKTQLPQADPAQIPYTVCGSYLRELFDRSFIVGLHKPELRPTAQDWEDALLKTIDLMQPCQNPNCSHKWFVFDDTSHPRCPFCGTVHKGVIPILNFYSLRREHFTTDKLRLVVFDKQFLYLWHVNRNFSPNEKLTDEQKKSVGYFIFHHGMWLLVNQRLPDLEDKTNNRKIPIGGAVELSDGKQILFSSRDTGARLAIVQCVGK